MVAYIWNSQIKSPYDIIRRTHFTCAYTDTDKAKAMVYARLFVARFNRWLKGVGHPHELVGTIVSEDMYKNSLDSPQITRALLFWKAISDTSVLPVSGIKSVRVRRFMSSYSVVNQYY